MRANGLGPKLRKFGIGVVQYAVLEHLASIAQRQKAHARVTHTGFDGGWTTMKYSRKVRPATVAGLITRGFVQPCCSGHGPHDSVRISRLGIELLEDVRGEEIMA